MSGAGRLGGSTVPSETKIKVATAINAIGAKKLTSSPYAKEDVGGELDCMVNTKDSLNQVVNRWSEVLSVTCGRYKLVSCDRCFASFKNRATSHCHFLGPAFWRRWIGVLGYRRSEGSLGCLRRYEP